MFAPAGLSHFRRVTDDGQFWPRRITPSEGGRVDDRQTNSVLFSEPADSGQVENRQMNSVLID